jgi:hypothetical protein
MSSIETLARPMTAADPVVQADMALPVLSRLEWQVVRIALAEADRAVAEPAAARSRLGRWIAASHRWLTGVEPAAGLADPRLEAVRRFVVAVRRGAADTGPRGEALLALGFSREQVRGIALAGR